MAVPLSLRIPNPPPDFLGRGEERDRLAHALQEAPAVVLAGPGGIGKTALAIETARHLGFARGGMFVRLPAGTSDPYGPILRALAQIGGHPGRQGLNGVTAADAKLARAIDMADALVPLIVVDDAHVAGRQALRELSNGVLSHAQRARWMFTSRERLINLPPSRQLIVDRLAPATVAALAQRWAPDLNQRERARLCRRSEGSPFRLLSAIRGELQDPVHDPALEQARLRLAVLRRPVPASDLDLEPSVLDALVDRGLVVRRGTRICLHDAARPSQLPSGYLRSAEVGQLLDGLGKDADAVLEQIRLRLLREEIESAAELLDAHGQRLIDEGYTPELAGLVPAEATEPLAGWGLRIAAERGENLERLTAPSPNADLATQAAWLEVRATLEDRHELYDLARSVAARARREEALEVACRADLIAASVCMMRGELERGSTILAEARPATPAQSLHVLAVQAMIAASRGDVAGARARVGRIEERLDETAGHDRGSLLYNLGVVFHLLKRPLDAAHLLARCIPDDALTTATPLGRRMLEMDAHMAVLAGNLPRARRRLVRLRRFVPEGHPADGRTRLIAAHVDFLEGRLARAEDGVRHALELAEGYGGVEDVAFARGLLSQLAWRNDEPPDAVPEAQTASASVTAAWHALAALSHSGTGSLPPGIASDERRELERLHAAIDAWLRQALPERARSLEAQLKREAPIPHALVWSVWAAEARVAAGGPFLVSEPLAQARTHGASELGDTLETLRCVENRDVAALLALARAGVSLATHVVDAPPSGQLRATLVARLRQHLDWRGVRGTFDADSLFIDAPRGQVYSALGQARFRTGAKPLALLGALVDHPTGVSKETLLLRVWGHDDYHPLRHDNRLRVAVRKLRQRLDPLLGRPFIETLDDGYRLMVPVRWMQAAPTKAKPRGDDDAR